MQTAALFRDCDELAWVTERQRAKKRSVHNAENGRICSHPKRQSRDCNSRESGIPTNYAKRVAEGPGGPQIRGQRRGGEFKRFDQARGSFPQNWRPTPDNRTDVYRPAAVPIVPANGLLATAYSRLGIRPAKNATRPASTASFIAYAIRSESSASAMAVLSSTPS